MLPSVNWHFATLNRMSNIIFNSVSEPRAGETKLTCLPELKLRIAAPAPFCKLLPTILILLLKSKRSFSSHLTKLSGAGAGAGAKIRIFGSVEPEQKEICSTSKLCF